MTNTDLDLLAADGDPNEGNAQAIIDIATAATAPHILAGSDASVVNIPAGGSAWLVNPAAQAEQFADHPLRARGESEAHDAVSLAAFVLKFGDTNTEVWASERDRKIVAVLNAGHRLDAADDPTFGPEPGWGDHRVSYQARRTPEWAQWIDTDGKLITQREFAELIEDRLSDIVRPASLDMLEVAQTFHATSTGVFKSSQRLRSGERKFVFEENINATAGGSGEVDVPETFDIRLAPYEGADVVDVTCRLRYRPQPQGLLLGYKIVDREQIERDAFRSVVAGVNTELAESSRGFAPVLMGVPAAPQTPILNRR